MADEFGGRLSFGIGLHSGFAVVGSIQIAGRLSLQFLGDTGNVAARLEALTKELGCRAIISEAVFETAGMKVPASLPRVECRVRGREQSPLACVLLHTGEEAWALRGPVAVG